jgi:hypothetical protein
MNSPSERPRKCFGLVHRKEVWALTWRGRVLLLLVVLSTCAGLVLGIHPFLALDTQVKSGVLVVEGWVPGHALTNYIVHHPEYQHIYTTGGPTLTDSGSNDISDTFAAVSYDKLRGAGVPVSRLLMVPAFEKTRDRTYASAVALREWCETNRVPLEAFDVATLGVHARRSRLLAQKAFPHARVGVVSLLNEEYDPDKWWRYSEGVKEVLSEGAAYLYSRFLFSPK